MSLLSADGLLKVYAVSKRIGIVAPFDHLDTISCICNAAELLAEAGYWVDVYGRPPSQKFPPAQFEHERINVVLPLGPRWERQGLYRFIPRRFCEPLDVLKRHRKIRYSCFIGVDPTGLILADKLTILVNVPLVYYSLELLLSYEHNKYRYQRRRKAKEIKLSRQSLFTIIQDKERAGLLASDNHLPNDKFVLVPNSPLGPARRKPTNYWHKRFDLPAETRVVLHAGQLGWWTGIADIVKSVREWPDHWVLVVHSARDYSRQEENPIPQLKELAPPGRVFFSDQPVKRQDYQELVDGGDIGIAFYVHKPDSAYTTLNARIIGLSSGKTMQYLRAGLPIIVNKTESISLSQLLERYRCGIVVEDSSQIGQAIAQIAGNYQEYSQRCVTMFNECLEFGKAFQQVIGRLEGIERQDAWNSGF